ncbi:MAG: hypothetical protein NTW89_07290 [Burkholderiales bacterium]|nr:hypothetical protein [Burkholderiales bacterium]
MQTKQQYYLAELSTRILLDKMAPEDRNYLAACIHAISLGQDANKIFKAARSKGSSDERMAATTRIKLAITHIAALMRPCYQSESDFSPSVPSGMGLSNRDALRRTAESFGIDEYTLERYWNDAKKNEPELLQPFIKFGDLLPE